jgi:hypothetical protein
MNLKNLILLVFEPDLQTRTLNVHEVKPPDVVTLKLLQCLLVVHRQTTSQVDSDQFVVSVKDPQVAHSHRTVLGLFFGLFESDQPPYQKSLLAAQNLLES